MHARMHAAAGIADLLGGWVGGGSGGILGTLPVVQPCSFFSPTGRRRMGGVRKNKSEYVRWPSCGNFGIGWRQTRDFFFILSCYIVCERAVRFHATHQVVAFFFFLVLARLEGVGTSIWANCQCPLASHNYGAASSVEAPCSSGAVCERGAHGWVRRGRKGKDGEAIFSLIITLSI